MAKYYCNPINMNYKYQFNEAGDKFSLNREAADPSMVLFKGKYYLFPSMTKGFLVSEDLANWTMFPIGDLPAYDYAPDVRVVGDYLYFCASRRGKICDFYRTKDPESGVFECIKGTFDFWDPNLFLDDDGRLYFYWGCSNATPIYGVELERETMKKIGEPVSLISNHQSEIGYERIGEDHGDSDKGNIYIDMIKTRAAEMMHCQPSEITDLEPILATIPPEHAQIVRGMLAHNPYIEGAWMTKYHGKYYLQYASPGTEFNIYSDGVYISENPLGPFRLASNNPYSYSPGGFCPGAGHGSTMQDLHKNWWHTSTMQISINHIFERRIGIWPCGFDHDDELFCNQRYGDWPIKIDSKSAKDPWEEPEWMLLSYKKTVTASSEEKPAINAVDESIKTWWKAKSNDHEWLKIDLEKIYVVNSIQLNFADEIVVKGFPDGAVVFDEMAGRRRYIDDRIFYTR